MAAARHAPLASSALLTPCFARICSPLPQDKPDYFDAEGTVKWNAWNAIAHMAKETAAQRYIAESKRQRTPMSQR